MVRISRSDRGGRLSWLVPRGEKERPSHLAAHSLLHSHHVQVTPAPASVLLTEEVGAATASGLDP
jgi:hypothetical protein